MIDKAGWGGLLAAVLATSVACSSSSKTTEPTTVLDPQTLPTTAPATEPVSELVFSVAAGTAERPMANHFVRKGPVAAHVVTRSGQDPRLLAVFPAGNSGIGVWFDNVESPVTMALSGGLDTVEEPSGLRGVRGRFTIDQPLRSRGLVLSSVRVMRDFANDPKLVPPIIKHEVEAGPPLVVRRTTIDGGHHFELVIEPIGEATASPLDGGNLQLSAGTFDIAFLHDDPPLEPLDADDVLTSDAADSPGDRQTLAFLTYGNKWLAGSWRFLTYFGRDTLLSVRLLMPALRPAAIEAAMSSVIERLSDDGQVAHEEDIGEFAAIRRHAEGKQPTREPIYDYKMVDDNFMLAPILAHYLLDHPAGKGRGQAFLDRKTSSGRSYREALAANLALILDRAAPFAQSGVATDMVSLLPGLPVGDWRDSNDGLGGGRYSYSVNASLVPAALDAAIRLWQSGLVPAPDGAIETATSYAEAWHKAHQQFQVSIPARAAGRALRRYSAEMGLAPAKSGASGDVSFAALALDDKGRPIRIMHTDEGFRLLFNQPDPAELESIAARLSAPFPAGLYTPVGLVIANPAHVTDPSWRRRFGRDRYHGAVIWSWQHALIAAGLERQLERSDLPEQTRTALSSAQSLLWKAIETSDAQRQSENWSWRVDYGVWKVDQLGGFMADDEGNAAQLWSTVFLAVKPPAK